MSKTRLFDTMEPAIEAVTEWQTPASLYPRIASGAARVADANYKAGIYEAYWTSPDGHKRVSHWRAVKRLRITMLKIGKRTWMVDDPPHWWATCEHAKQYSGNILVAGLGLGLIVHCLRANPAVKKITVVERDADVISLIGPLVPKCEIVHSDWYNFKTRQRVHGVYFDLFVGNGPALLVEAFNEQARLRQAYPEAQVRILGFEQSMLDRVADKIIAAQNLVKAV